MEEVNDSIRKPAHYCAGRKYEPIDVIADWKLDFDLGNVVKYISRAGRKIRGENTRELDEITDLEKAAVYLNHAIKEREENGLLGGNDE